MNLKSSTLLSFANLSHMVRHASVSTVWIWLLGTVLTLLAQTASVSAQTVQRAEKLRVYLIGNSLTWDCVPAALGVDAQWHVDCGKNLKQIFNAPEKPCVPSSLVWTKALQENKYDVLCIQPHYGTRLSEDIDMVSRWVAMQPQAMLVLHSGWPKHLEISQESADAGTATTVTGASTMHHSVNYMHELALGVAARHAGLKVRHTRVLEALQHIELDIRQGGAPIKKVSELYRDDIHLTFAGGRYLAHNMLRQSLGLALSSQGFQLDDDLKSYLDKTITRFGEAR